MIEKKEDLMNTYIVNDCPVKRDAYISLAEKLGCSLMGGQSIQYVKDSINDGNFEYTAIEKDGNLFARINLADMKSPCGYERSQIPADFKQLHLSDLIDLTNSKVYTTDPEVIRKYADLCGKESFDQQIPTAGVFNRDTANKVYNFSPDSPTDKDDTLSVVTAPKINALHTEKFCDAVAVELQEEKEAFDAICAAEWDGNGLPPVGFPCVYVFNDETEYSGFVAAYHDDAVWFSCSGGLYKTFIAASHEFRKQETEAERNERERLEAAYDLYCTAQSAIDSEVIDYSDFIKNSRQLRGTLAIMNKTGYRK